MRCQHRACGRLIVQHGDVNVKGARRVVAHVGAGAVVGGALIAALIAVTVVGTHRSRIVPVEAAVSAPPEPFDIPWVDRPAPPPPHVAPVTAPPPPSDARRCRAEDVTIGDAGGNGATGTLFTSFAFTNVSSTTCSLVGFPAVSVSAPGRRPIAATPATGFPAENTGGNVAPGESARVSLVTERDCDARYATTNTYPTVIYNTVTFELAASVKRHTTRLDVLCGLATTAFSVPQAPPAPAVEAAAALTAAIQLPPSAHPGERLTYVVALSNPTGAPILLDPCPAYIQWLTGTEPATKTANGLNCDTVHAIEPRSTMRFQIKLKIPAQAPPGDPQLHWSLEMATGALATGYLHLQ